MNTTAQIRPSRTSSGPERPADPPRSPRAPDSEPPTFGEMLSEIVPLIGFIPTAGPPVVFLLGPWLLLGLVLAGPLAWLFALVVVMLFVATVLAVFTAAIVVAPYRLVRHLRRRRAAQASISAPAANLLPFESPRVAA